MASSTPLTTLAQISRNPDDNYPSGAVNSPSTIDNASRDTQALLKQAISKGTSIASATTIIIPDDGGSFAITGAVAIAAINPSWEGRHVTLLPASTITIMGAVKAAGAVVEMVYASGVWIIDPIRADLADNTDPTKGAGIPRFNAALNYALGTLGAKLKEFVSVTDFPWLAKFDGVTDDTAAIQAAINTGLRVLCPSGRTAVAANLISVAGGGLICLQGSSTIKVAAGTNAGLSVRHSNFNVDGIDFDGGDTRAFDVATPPALGARIGLRVGADLGAGGNLKGITIKNVNAYGFDRIGVQGLETVTGFSAGKCVVWDNVNSYNNHYNWDIQPTHEYSTFTHCYAYKGYVGIQQIGGNNTYLACHFTYNFINCDLQPGLNEHHGAFIGCSFNHAVSKGLRATNVNGAGMNFVSCLFWYAPIELNNCIGIMITKGQIANSHITVIGGGLNMIDDNYTPYGLSKTLTGNTFTSFRRNRTSAVDTGQAATLGDYFVKSTASSFAFPIAFNATTYSNLALIYDSVLWHGESLPALADAAGVLAPRTMFINVDASIGFNTLAVSEKPVLKLELWRAGAPVESFLDSREFSASQTECMLRISQRVQFLNGDQLRLFLKTRSATGISIPSGGIKVIYKSED